VKSNAAYIEGTQGQSGAHFNGEGQGQHFTQDQYSQLIHMLQNVRVNQSEGSSGDASANAVTCAGKVFNKTPHKVIDFNQRTWILDSGATQHMCFDSKIFLELNTLKTPVFVDLPNSHRVKVTQVGCVPLDTKLILKDVLFVPCFKYNLISVYKLCKQLSCLLIFSSFGCFLQGPSMKRPLAFGKARTGLYLLESSFQYLKSFVSTSVNLCN